MVFIIVRTVFAPVHLTPGRWGEGIAEYSWSRQSIGIFVVWQTSICLPFVAGMLSVVSSIRIWALLAQFAQHTMTYLSCLVRCFWIYSLFDWEKAGSRTGLWHGRG